VWNRQRWPEEMVSDTHRLEVAVYDIHGMQVLQSACCLCELQGYFRFEDWGGSGDWAYETKEVDLGALIREVHDVSVNHPLGNYTQREQLWGDTQHR